MMINRMSKNNIQSKDVFVKGRHDGPDDKNDIAEIVEFIVALVILALFFPYMVGLFKDYKYRHQKEINCSMLVTYDGSIETTEDVKKLIADRVIPISIKDSSTNNTPRTRALKNRRSDLIKREYELETGFWLSNSFKLKWSESPEETEHTEGNEERILTVPPGQARYGQLSAYTDALTTDEIRQLLLLETDQDVLEHQSGIYRMISEHIAKIYSATEDKYRFKLSYVNLDDGTQHSAVFGFLFPEMKSTSKMDRRQINYNFQVFRAEDTEYGNYLAMNEISVFSENEELKDLLLSYLGNKKYSKDLKNIAVLYAYNAFERNLDDLEEYSGHKIDKVFVRDYQIDEDEKTNEEIMDKIKEDEELKDFLEKTDCGNFGFIDYDTDSSHYIIMVFSNET